MRLNRRLDSVHPAGSGSQRAGGLSKWSARTSRWLPRWERDARNDVYRRFKRNSNGRGEGGAPEDSDWLGMWRGGGTVDEKMIGGWGGGGRTRNQWGGSRSDVEGLLED